MMQKRISALVVLLIGVSIGWSVYASQTHEWRPFKLGLDLSGGTQLLYRANTANIPAADVADSMAALRDTIERRVNLFGVSEPLVETETGGGISGQSEQRLLVELPGVTDTQKAISLIGQTPVLEFRLVKPGVETIPPDVATSSLEHYFEAAMITGKDLESAQLQFQGQSAGLSQPVVVLKFNSQGADIFADITKNNIGRVMAIFLDGSPISAPVIQDAITDGTAVISGSFTPEGAKELARDLNYGALPVPIELVQTQTVSATLGGEAVERGIMAGIVGVLAIILFMIFWYRLPGLLASVALLVYIAGMLGLFILIPVTLTAAGIAAFILSVGMAVDANILIFERTREELKSGKSIEEAISDGFSRAWPSIRDSNISSIITAVILFWFGTSLIRGFALVFGLGVLVSMLTAISVSRTFLKALGIRAKSGPVRFFFGSGIKS
ncbi:MAG TPA: protein translocase subunit SecD [Candidatus Paceibacterota bacterium]